VSKIIEYIEDLLNDGASPRMAILAASKEFDLGGLSLRQLWDYYEVPALTNEELN